MTPARELLDRALRATLLAATLALPSFGQQAVQGEVTDRVPKGQHLGFWEDAYDWGLPICAGAAYDEADLCYTANCTGLPWGEIVHAQLFLQNPTEYSEDPDNVDPNWRVMLIDTGNFDTTEQAWRLWDPDRPTELIEGHPKLPLTIFCAGHTALADGRLMWVGGQRWPAAGHGSCLPWGSQYGFIYDPEGEQFGSGGPGTWVRLQNMLWPRYYPTPVLLPDERVMVVAGNTQPPHFEVYDPKQNKWDNHIYPFTDKPCPTIYPRVHLLPSIEPSLSTGTLVSTGPFLLDQIDPPFMCGGEPGVVGIQRHFLLPDGFNDNPYWGSAIQPAIETNRAEAASVVIIDATVDPPQSRIVFGGGMETAFFGEVFDSVEMIVDGHTVAGRSIEMPSLNFPRFYHLFVLLPGQRILALGGDSGDGLNPAVMNPEILDLKDLDAGWTVLPAHDFARIYHSWALLLPDGRVMHGGGRSINDETPYKHAQIYNPGFLPQGQGFGLRPTFGRDNSARMNYGEDFDVRLAANGAGVRSFELIRPGASTHGSDFDQRLIILPFEKETDKRYVVKAPTRGDIAPPGWYMLFAVDERGIPSKGHWVKLNSQPTDGTFSEVDPEGREASPGK